MRFQEAAKLAASRLKGSLLFVGVGVVEYRATVEENVKD